MPEPISAALKTPLEVKPDPPGGRNATENASPSSKEAAQPSSAPPRHDNWRETVESIVVAFVLAFLFRTFEAEAFVIPTGSMAPTLYGQHLDVHCTKCGTRFALGASDDVEHGLLQPGKRADSAVCYNCRFPNTVLKEEIFKGDRILVNKFPYEIGTPDRWDVIVFKNPNEAKTNYIKRLAGLPGEDVRIEWGDVYVRKLGSQDPFKIPRKPPEKQRKLQIPVYDNDHPARELLNAGWPERWTSDEGSEWSGDADQRTFRIDPNPLNPERSHWLRYRHLVPSSEDWIHVQEHRPLKPPRPQLITDFYAYNAKVSAQDALGNREPLPDLDYDSLGVQWVGDLTVSCTVELLAAEGELQCELVEGERRYRCRIDLKTGRASLSLLNDQIKQGQINKEEEALTQLAEGETGMNAPGEYALSFANVDDRVCLWVNDRLVSSVEFDPGSRHSPQAPPISPTDRDLAPVGFAAKGASLRLAHLRLERDIYYRYPGQGVRDGHEYAPPQNAQELRNLLSDPVRWSLVYNEGRKFGQYQLKDDPNDLEDEFFVLGDNSPRSLDSRLWNVSPAVPRRLLIGKAFFIYWPHAVPFMNDGKGYAISNYKEEGPMDQRTRRPTTKEAFPPVPTSSFPFYPQVGRMKRIR